MRLRISGRRVLYLAIGIGLFMAAYSIGAAMPLTDDQAKEVKKQFSQQIGGIDQNGIFLNNVRIALAEFIPAVGGAVGLFSGYGTGAVFSAIAKGSPTLAKVPAVIVLLTPFGAMEIFAYGLAISRSGNLVYRLIKDRPWMLANRRPFFDNSLLPTFIEIGIVVGVLFAAAVIEWALIQLAGGIGRASGIG
jgi:hypothetical protein